MELKELNRKVKAMVYYMRSEYHKAIIDLLMVKSGMRAYSLTARIDKTMEDEDLNNDGYLTYDEFAVARRKDKYMGL